MICNKCMVQMHQKDQIGGGRAEENEYTTWELKECPACGRSVIEYYAAIKVTDEGIKKGDSIELNLKINITE